MGEDRLSCMVRDPNWIHCYWELGGDALARASKGRSPRFLETVRWVLRVSPSGGEPYDVEVGARARNWYLKVEAGTRYRIGMGLVTVGGDFVALAADVEAATPPEPLSGLAARDWGPLRSELERMVDEGLVGAVASSFSSASGGGLTGSTAASDPGSDRSAPRGRA